MTKYHNNNIHFIGVYYYNVDTSYPNINNCQYTERSTLGYQHVSLLSVSIIGIECNKIFNS